MNPYKGFFVMNPKNWAYLAASVMSAFFFIFGVTTGILINQSSSEYTTEQIAALQGRVENAQLEYIYLNTMGETIGCESMSSLIDASTNDVWSIGRELVELEKKGASDKTYSKLKRDYALLSVKAWILHSYVREKCNMTSPVVMYFYSIPCDECVAQGLILDDIRQNNFPNMKIFVLDYGQKEGIIDAVKSSHNLTRTPAIIIGNQTYQGLHTKEELMRTLNHSGPPTPEAAADEL